MSTQESGEQSEPRRLARHMARQGVDLTEVRAVVIRNLEEAQKWAGETHDHLTGAAAGLRDAGWPDEGEIWDGGLTGDTELHRRIVQLIGNMAMVERNIGELQQLLTQALHNDD